METAAIHITIKSTKADLAPVSAILCHMCHSWITPVFIQVWWPMHQ